MNKIKKFLQKLNKKLRVEVEEAISRVESDQLKGCDVIKLTNREREYRVKIGSIRIQFMKTEMGNVVTKAGFRNEKTYY